MVEVMVVGKVVEVTYINMEMHADYDRFLLMIVTKKKIAIMIKGLRDNKWIVLMDGFAVLVKKELKKSPYQPLQLHKVLAALIMDQKYREHAINMFADTPVVILMDHFNVYKNHITPSQCV